MPRITFFVSPQTREHQPTTKHFIIGCTTVARGGRVHQPTVMPLTLSLQDQREMARNPQSSRSAGQSKGLVIIMQESLGIPHSLITILSGVLMTFSIHHFTAITRAMIKRGSDDIMKLAAVQVRLVRPRSRTSCVGSQLIVAQPSKKTQDAENCA